MGLGIRVLRKIVDDLLTFVDFAKCSASEPLNYLVSALEYLRAVVNELIIEHLSQHQLWMVAI